MGKKSTEPLQITIKLADGRINSVDGMVMFDSIIYHAWFCKYAPQILQNGGEDDYAGGYMGLPFYQLPGSRYAASRGIYTEVSTSIEYINKRPNFFSADKMQYLADIKGIISDASGLYRAYRIPFVIRTLKDKEITFYAMGNAEKINDLLSYIPAVGKKPAAGYGIIESWEIKACDADYSLWHPDFGLMRPVPIDSDEVNVYPEIAKKYPVMRYAVRPPYWKGKNMQTCYVPIEVRNDN